MLRGIAPASNGFQMTFHGGRIDTNENDDDGERQKYLANLSAEEKYILGLGQNLDFVDYFKRKKNLSHARTVHWVGNDATWMDYLFCFKPEGIDPQKSVLIKYWDGWILVLLIFTALITPYEVLSWNQNWAPCSSSIALWMCPSCTTCF